MKKYDCIIVGAGPAGSLCFGTCQAEKGQNILILDKRQDLKDRKCPSRKRMPLVSAVPPVLLFPAGRAPAPSVTASWPTHEVGGMLGSYLDQK